jgi:hypothetical protein
MVHGSTAGSVPTTTRIETHGTPGSVTRPVHRYAAPEAVASGRMRSTGGGVGSGVGVGVGLGVGVGVEVGSGLGVAVGVSVAATDVVAGVASADSPPLHATPAIMSTRAVRGTPKRGARLACIARSYAGMVAGV